MVPTRRAPDRDCGRPDADEFDALYEDIARHSIAEEPW
jgi:hypothetical protein